MIGYSAIEVFTTVQIEWCARAVDIVRDLPDVDQFTRYVRCHEVARIVGEALQLPVVDGMFGSSEHSWLDATSLYPKLKGQRFAQSPSNAILDVYSVARLPMVQLVHVRLPTTDYRPFDRSPSNYTASLFYAGSDRKDIRHDVLKYLRNERELIRLRTEKTAKAKKVAGGR